MMRKPFISLLCPIARLVLSLSKVWCHGAPSAKGSSPSVIMLETDTIRLDFQPARNGGITSIVDKVSGQKFDGPKTTSLLYEIQLEGPGAKPIMLSEADAVDATVTKEGESVVIRVPRHKDLPVGVECRFR